MSYPVQQQCARHGAYLSETPHSCPTCVPVATRKPRPFPPTICNGIIHAAEVPPTECDAITIRDGFVHFLPAGQAGWRSVPASGVYLIEWPDGAGGH